jgi:DNA-binding NtrC family response regulator
MGSRAGSLHGWAVGFFEKPYDADQLLAALARALGEPVAHAPTFVMEP